MSIEKELLHMEMQQHEMEFLYYSATLTICSAGVDVLSEKYPDDLEMAYGALGAVKFIKEKADESYKAVQSSRELLGMESLPDDRIQATKIISQRVNEEAEKTVQ